MEAGEISAHWLNDQKIHTGGEGPIRKAAGHGSAMGRVRLWGVYTPSSNAFPPGSSFSLFKPTSQLPSLVSFLLPILFYLLPSPYLD